MQIRSVLTLAIETSTPHGSVALHDGGTLLFCERFVAERGHSALLFPLLQAALRIAPQPSQIAVGLGPGSYAGVRIAIATAMGLDLVLHAQLVGVPSVATFQDAPDHYLAVGDARREAFYYTEVERGVCLEGPLLLGGEELQERLRGSQLPVLSSDLLPAFPQVRRAFPSAARLAAFSATSRGIVMTKTLEPIYLREAHITKPNAIAL